MNQDSLEFWPSVGSILSIRNQSLEGRLFEALSLCTFNEHSFLLVISAWGSRSLIQKAFIPVCLLSGLQGLLQCAAAITCKPLCCFAFSLTLSLSTLLPRVFTWVRVGFWQWGPFCSSWAVLLNPISLADLVNNGCIASLLLQSVCFSHWDGTEHSWAMPFYCSSLSLPLEI